MHLELFNLFILALLFISGESVKITTIVFLIFTAWTQFRPKTFLECSAVTVVLVQWETEKHHQYETETLALYLKPKSETAHRSNHLYTL